MRIVDIINGDKPSLSFEVFPPKSSDSFESVLSASISAHFILGGHTSIGFNITEFIERVLS